MLFLNKIGINNIKILGGICLRGINNKNNLFVIVSIISGIFIISPLLLRIPFIYGICSWFLQPLGNSGYKSSYTETFGAILGTFLAVTGALWTQKKIDKAAEKKELKESALIVYYDFKFAFSDIITFMKSYLFSQEKVENIIEDFETYKKLRKKYYIYIDDDWIHNVAKLSSSLSSNEIQIIYKLYGDLNTIKKVFNTSINNISDDEEKLAYSKMFNEICNIEFELKNPICIEVSLKENIENIMEKLKVIGDIIDMDE